MKLTVLASGSSGNGYLLEGRNSALVIECGVKPAEMFKRTGVRPGKIAGCLVSHEHGDHAAYVDMYAAMGLRIYASRGTIEQSIRPGSLARFHILVPMESKVIGEFIVRPFDVRHDAAEPLGFVVEHAEMGRMLFVTDTRMVPYTFKSYKVDHMLIPSPTGTLSPTLSLSLDGVTLVRDPLQGGTAEECHPHPSPRAEQRPGAVREEDAGHDPFRRCDGGPPRSGGGTETQRVLMYEGFAVHNTRPRCPE